MDQPIVDFCRQVRARSAEHQEAILALLRTGALGVAVGLLRQELDSLIRVAYLCDQGASSQVAQSLMQDSVNGDQWKTTTNNGRARRITDREMVNLAAQLGGWVEIIYSFGCKLIHLSNLHDHNASDPFANISQADRTDIIEYLRSYHHYPALDIDKDRFALYLPKVMQKLIDNVAYYVNEIEAANAAQL